MGFADQPVGVLEILRGNLLAGLDRVAEHVDAGTLHVIPAGGAVPPAEVGCLIMRLLQQVETELAGRAG